MVKTKRVRTLEKMAMGYLRKNSQMRERTSEGEGERIQKCKIFMFGYIMCRGEGVTLLLWCGGLHGRAVAVSL